MNFARALFAGALALAASQAAAADLRIALSAAPTSVDPQFHVIGPNSALARNIFDGLVNQDAAQRLQPALAETWTQPEPTLWEIKLRANVKFHDGSPFTSADVAASLARVALAARSSPSSFQPYVRDIAAVEPVDALTVRIRTKAPAPGLLHALSRIAILPAAQRETPTADLNAGRGVIGTGPYRFVSWQRDSGAVLARNDGYWGAKPAWDKVTFRFIADNGARVAALLAGDVDVIENVPSVDLARLRSGNAFKVVATPSNRVMYLHMDQHREVSPFAVGPDGKNPLLKRAVREALSLAINRKALVERIMDGLGEPAGQLVPAGYFGWSPALAVDPFDPERARKLLAEAGYPNGFKLTLHASNDRYPNDSKVAQAIGQMLSRIGVEIGVDVMAGSVFFPRGSKLEFSFLMGGAAVETGEASGVIAPLLATFSQTAGQGNRGRYSSPDLDKALAEAATARDMAQREAHLRRAMDIGMRDRGVIPVFFLGYAWAMRSAIRYKGRADGYTLAEDFGG